MHVGFVPSDLRNCEPTVLLPGIPLDHDIIETSKTAIAIRSRDPEMSGSHPHHRPTQVGVRWRDAKPRRLVVDGPGQVEDRVTIRDEVVVDATLEGGPARPLRDVSQLFLGDTPPKDVQRDGESPSHDEEHDDGPSGPSDDARGLLGRHG